MIDNYIDGSDITIMNNYYQYGVKDADGNRLDDFMVMVYKDNVTKQKKFEIIKKPEYTFYVSKPNVSLDHNRLFISKEKAEPVVVRYSKLESKLAELAGMKEEYKENIMNGNRAENRKLHALPQFFMSDMSIEDEYRFMFNKRFTNNINKLSKAFFDIEVDGRYAAGDFVQPGECPVNAVAFFDETHNVINQFILRNDKNPLIVNYENDIKYGNITHKEIIDFISSAVGGWKQMKRYNLESLQVNITFYDNEIELLKTFFQAVHKYSPDFILGWNSSAFDLAYIIARIYALGFEPSDIMADQSWPVKVVRNYVDEKNLSNFAERGDYTFISGTTVWLDQMIQFCSRRKSKIGSFESFKLDDIGALVAKVHKLDYSYITTNIAMLPYLNFKIFSFYNLMDVIVQKTIEAKSQDVEYVFAQTIVNNVAYKKAHRQTVYLIDRMAKEWDKLGYIIGNNINKWNEKPSEKFLGALVHDPAHTGDYSKMKINNIPIMIVESLVDYDFKSLYPSIILEHNIAPNTQIGRIDIQNKVYENENAYMNEKYTRSGEFIENMVTDNILEFSTRWFHLGSVSEVLDDIKEFQSNFRRSFGSFGNYGIWKNTDTEMVYDVPIKDTTETNGISHPINFNNANADRPIFILNGRGR